MNENQLRRLVREEITKVFDADVIVDDHVKFRRLVERHLGRRLQEGESYDETYGAWQSILTEAGDTSLDPKLIEYYVTEAVSSINSTVS